MELYGVVWSYLELFGVIWSYVKNGAVLSVAYFYITTFFYLTYFTESKIKIVSKVGSSIIIKIVLIMTLSLN
jgi:hypothetical protein